MSEEKENLTTAKAAQLLGHTEEQVRNLCQTGDLPGAEQDYDGAPWRIPLKAVEDRLRHQKPEKLPFYKRHFFSNMKKYYGVIFAILTFLALLFGALADSGIRDWVYQQIRGRPFEPATENEALIVIATFYRTEGVVDVAAHDEIRRAIQEKINDLNLENVRVAVEPTIIETANRSEAEELGSKYDATLVIWGSDSGIRLEVNFLNLKEPNFDAAEAIISETIKTQLANPKAYSQFVMSELPGQVTYLSLFALGQAASSQDNYENAILLIESAIVSLPDLITINETLLELDAAYFRLGWLYLVTDKISSSIVAYDEVLKLNPENTAALINRGNAFSNQGNYEQAIVDYSAAIGLNPEISEAFFNRGNAFLNQDRYELAIADYDQAISLNPELDAAFTNRGIAYFSLGKHERAITNYNQAIDLNPLLAAAFVNRGNVYYRQEKYEMAISDYDQAISLNPEFATAFTNRGNAHFNLNNYEQAFKDYGHAIALNPEDAETFYSRGYAHYSQEEFERAIADYNRAIAIKSDFVEAIFNRGLAYFNHGNTEYAIADFTQVIALNPGEAGAFFNLGMAHFTQDEYERAISNFDQAIASNPEFSEAFFNRGNAYYNLANYESALVDFQRYLVLESQSIHAPAWKNVCWLGTLLGYAEEVVYPCEKLVYLSSDKFTEASYLDTRGLNRALRGDFNGAISDFEIFVDTFHGIPDYETLVEMRISWINSLNAQESPFNEDMLEDLLNKETTH